MNSVIRRAGHEMMRSRDDFRAARTRPNTAATRKPKAVACMVTTRPLSRMGRIEDAKSQSLVVSHSMPNSMSGPPRAPAPDRAFQQLHDGGHDQCHAEVHKQQQGIDGHAILCEVTDLFGTEGQVAQADQ